MTGSCLGIDRVCMTFKTGRTSSTTMTRSFQHMTDRTRWYNECRTCLCGRKRRTHPVKLTVLLCVMCYRSSFPCPCIPLLSNLFLPMHVSRQELYVKDASQALTEIKTALRNATIRMILYQDQFRQEQGLRGK